MLSIRRSILTLAACVLSICLSGQRQSWAQSECDQLRSSLLAQVNAARSSYQSCIASNPYELGSQVSVPAGCLGYTGTHMNCVSAAQAVCQSKAAMESEVAACRSQARSDENSNFTSDTVETLNSGRSGNGAGTISKSLTEQALGFINENGQVSLDALGDSISDFDRGSTSNIPGSDGLRHRDPYDQKIKERLDEFSESLFEKTVIGRPSERSPELQDVRDRLQQALDEGLQQIENERKEAEYEPYSDASRYESEGAMQELMRDMEQRDAAAKAAAQRRQQSRASKPKNLTGFDSYAACQRYAIQMSRLYTDWRGAENWYCVDVWKRYGRPGVWSDYGG